MQKGYRPMPNLSVSGDLSGNRSNNPAIPDRLFFFGEDSEKPLIKKRGRKPKISSTRLHPNSLSHEVLMASVGAYPPSVQNTEKTLIILNLPARGNIPLLSDDPAAGEDISFMPFEIPALSVPLFDLYLFLPMMNDLRLQPCHLKHY